MSSLEQRLSRIEEKLKQENEEARRRIDLNIDMSPQRSRPRPIIVIQLSPAPAPSQRAGIIQSIAPSATAPPNICVPCLELFLCSFIILSTSYLLCAYNTAYNALER
ncbi:hypothetical protein ILYODFUR_000426 [Ilyodon furcidens]|uniref:Uncharacterized protein n=1 Tax=Ilyodon furcidens TaxID=33524 RepID=A0ABV0V9W7_9TELE